MNFIPRGGELILILLVVLVLFGPKQLPKLGKMFGQTMRSLREGAEGKLGDGTDDEDETKVAASEDAEVKA